MNRREKLLAGLDLCSTTGIEIGALTSPIVTPSEGNIIYVDHADSETLRRKYADHAGVDVTRIVEVNAVWGTNTLQEAIGKDRTVDYVIASHVIEHVPDLLGWLEEIEGVLGPEGTLRLAVPDRRYSFDYLRQETRLSDLLNARIAKARAPLPTQIIDHVIEVVEMDANAAWQGAVDEAKLRRLHTMQDAISMAEDARRNGSYHDVHCWVFTPQSFASLLGRTAALGLHVFACVDLYDTLPGELEFQVILKPDTDRETAARSWDRFTKFVRVDVPCSATKAEADDLRLRLSEAEAWATELSKRKMVAEERVAAMEASSSWRITRPARALGRCLKPRQPRPVEERPIVMTEAHDESGRLAAAPVSDPVLAPQDQHPATSSAEATVVPPTPSDRPSEGTRNDMPDNIETSEPFGEKYFMDSASGSAYHVNNYLETALLSRTYFEMAEIIARCFEPNSVLEVGCAAGPTIYHLNNFYNTNARGVDVSQWAVEHRLHPNISQASAHQLPFADESFDVVFSCHALEHLTLEILEAAIAEMSRVATPDAVQYHLLPILGSGPYTDVFGSMVGLRRDPTHHLLFNRERWLKAWATHGWTDAGVQVAHVYDNHSFEFSDCQIILTRRPLTTDICRRIARKNLDVARTYQNALVKRPAPGLETFLNDIRDNWK